MKSNEMKEGVVKLWNPNAAANWSLLFSPIFGAWIQAENWKTLNHPEYAKVSMMWVIIGFLLIIVSFFIPVPKGVGILFLLIWYFANGKKQIKYIQQNNIKYEKKPWTKPLLIALVSLLGYLGLIFAFIYFKS